MRSKSLISALALTGVLLLVEQESAQAGFLSASPVSWQAADEVVVEGWFEVGAGSSAPNEEPADSSDLMGLVLNAALSATVGVFSPGGMSSSVPDVSGPGVPFVAVIPTTPSSDLPMVTWVRTEGRASLPRPPGSGILRPPRNSPVVSVV